MYLAKYVANILLFAVDTQMFIANVILIFFYLKIDFFAVSVQDSAAIYWLVAADVWREMVRYKY